MIYKLMPVSTVENLYQKVGFFVVKFPKSDKLFRYDGYCQSKGKTILQPFHSYNHVETNADALLVELTHKTYTVQRLNNEEDYNLALSMYEMYANQKVLSEALNFLYLLSLVIADYESEHHPIAVLSTVDFIDILLEERQLQWTDVRNALGYHRSISIPFLKTTLSASNIRGCDIVKLSHFFHLPVQAFIVGGYE